VIRLGTALGGNVETPSATFEVLASLDSELVALDLNLHTADTVEVLEIFLSTPHIVFGMQEVSATYLYIA
jgi:hypothetical protein